MNNYLQKKDAGDRTLFTGIAVLFCVLISAILVYVSADYNTEINKNSQIEQIMRTYIEKMQTTGYLTDEQKIDLENDLTELGCTNIRFGNTSFSPVAYGDYVYLDIYFDIQITTWSFTNGSFLESVRSSELKTDVHKHKKGTAQY